MKSNLTILLALIAIAAISGSILDDGSREDIAPQEESTDFDATDSADYDAPTDISEEDDVDGQVDEALSDSIALHGDRRQCHNFWTLINCGQSAWKRLCPDCCSKGGTNCCRKYPSGCTTAKPPAPKPLSSPKGFKCNKKKRFVPGAGYSQWSSFTNKGGEDGRAKCRAHFKNGAAAPNGWWYQFYSNGHFNCAKFNSKVTVPESKWENTHGRPEEVCVPAASPCAGKHNIKNRAYRESPDAYCKRFIPIAGCNAWHIKKYCPLACCLKGE